MTGVLRGIRTALLITLFILLGGLAWSALNLGGIKMSLLVDVGVVISCLAGGYRAGKETGQWMLGGAAGIGYVGIGIIILALFLPVNGIGGMEVLAGGGIVGTIGGIFSTQGNRGKNRMYRSRFDSTHYDERKESWKPQKWTKPDLGQNWRMDRDSDSVYGGEQLYLETGKADLKSRVVQEESDEDLYSFPSEQEVKKETRNEKKQEEQTKERWGSHEFEKDLERKGRNTQWWEEDMKKTIHL